MKHVDAAVALDADSQGAAEDVEQDPIDAQHNSWLCLAFAMRNVTDMAAEHQSCTTESFVASASSGIQSSHPSQSSASRAQVRSNVRRRMPSSTASRLSSRSCERIIRWSSGCSCWIGSRARERSWAEVCVAAAGCLCDSRANQHSVSACL